MVLPPDGLMVIMDQGISGPGPGGQSSVRVNPRPGMGTPLLWVPSRREGDEQHYSGIQHNRLFLKGFLQNYQILKPDLEQIWKSDLSIGFC